MKLVRIFVCAIVALAVLGLLTPTSAAQQLVAKSSGQVRPDDGLKQGDRTAEKNTDGQAVPVGGDVAMRPANKDVPTSALPRVIRFSSSMNDASGTAVNGRVQITFTLYSEANSTDALWTETHAVDVVDGKYNVLLGSTNKDGIPGELFSTDTARWLSVKIEGQPEQPRSLLVSVPYAMKAVEAERLSGKLASDFVTHEQMANAVRASVQREVSAAAPQTRPSGLTTNTSANFIDNNSSQVLLVQQQGTGNAIFAQTQGLTSIFGWSQATNGNGIGVNGQSDSISGRGVLGNSTSLVGSTAGVQGTANSTVGVGVLGTELSNSGTTYGVQGNANSTAGIGVGGFANANFGSNIGVLGTSASNSGIGVQGVASSANGSSIGVDAQSASNTGIALRAGVTNGGIIFAGMSNNFVVLTIDALGRLSTTDSHGNQFATGFTAFDTGASGTTPIQNGIGLTGVSTFSGTGFGTGVYGETSSQSGAGLWGLSKSSSGSHAPGVYAEALSNAGVAGWFETFSATGNTTGLFAQSFSPNGVAGILNLGNNTASPILCFPGVASRILSLQNNCVEKASFDSNGRLAINTGTITSNGPSISNTVIWNSAGIAFTNILSNVTDSGSTAASKLIDLQVNNVSKFSVDKSGNTVLGGSLTVGGAISGTFNAATATALAATPTQCIAGNVATGIQANGNANCSALSFTNVSGVAAKAQLPAVTVYSDVLYNDPAFINSLAGAKITGSVANATNAATAANSLQLNGLADTAYAKLAVANSFTAKQSFVPSSTGSASLNIPSGVAPTVPVSGDIWNQGGTLSFFNGATKTIAFTDSALTGNGSGLTSLSGGNITASSIPNSALINNSINVSPGAGLSSIPANGSVSLGGTVTLGIASGGVTNLMLQNNAIAVSYGPSGISGDPAVVLGGTLHINNTGVVAINTASPILTSTTSGSPTISCPTCVVNNANNVYTGGTQDFSTAGATIPVRSFAFASFPASCVANKEMIVRTDPSTPGQSLYVCNVGGNGWNLVGDGTGAGSFSVTPADGTIVVTGVAPNFQVKVGTITNANIVDNTINPAKIVGGLGGFAVLSGNNAFTGINTISNGSANATVLTVNATDTTGSDTAIKGAAAASATGNSVGVFGTSAANGTFAAGVFGQGTNANTYGGLFNNTSGPTAVGLAVLDNVGSAAPVFTVKGNGNVNATGTITATSFNGNLNGNITGGVNAGTNNITTTSGNISTGTGTITSGGLLTASNGLTVSAGGANITGDSTFNNKLTVTQLLTANGGITSPSNIVTTGTGNIQATGTGSLSTANGSITGNFATAGNAVAGISTDATNTAGSAGVFGSSNQVNGVGVNARNTSGNANVALSVQVDHRCPELQSDQRRCSQFHRQYHQCSQCPRRECQRHNGYPNRRNEPH